MAGLEGLKNPYLDLDQRGGAQAYYMWIDGTGQFIRGKSKTLLEPCHNPEELPIWDFDGSSCGQALGENSDVYIKPVACFRDPFRRGDNVLVMCETLTHEFEPHPSNHRRACYENMERCKEMKPWFGIEQEYTMFDFTGRHPYGWPANGYPGPQKVPNVVSKDYSLGPYYCGVGTDRVMGRQIVEAHYRACMYAGIKISGSNAEVMPSQWEYQVGPCEGIEMGDHLWVSRWILQRIAEEFSVVISFDPKPIPGDWNGAGCHTNISTLPMRTEGGLEHIYEAIHKMEPKHLDHINDYDPLGGEDNKRRLTGLHETASIYNFTYGVAHRGASIRIPRQVATAGMGYFEDRRPSSNADPYLVTDRIVKTICLDE